MQKTILITGCSSGIGLAAAKTLLARGYRVFATARKAADVAKLQELGLESMILDVDDSASIKAAVTAILAQTGGTLTQKTFDNRTTRCRGNEINRRIGKPQTQNPLLHWHTGDCRRAVTPLVTGCRFGLDSQKNGRK